MTDGARSSDPSGFIDTVADRIAAGRRTRRSLPGGGRLNVERQLPYLVVHRQPSGSDAGTARMVTAHAAYLTAGADRRRRRFVRDLTARIVALQAEVFRAVLVVELWSDPDLGPDGDGEDEGTRPAFRLHVPRAHEHARYVEHLVAELGRITVAKRRATVELVSSPHPSPPGFQPLLTRRQRQEASAHLIGLELAPVYRGRDGEEFPLLGRDLRRQLTRVLATAFFEFARDETSSRPPSYHALGRQATVKAVWEIDAELAGIGRSYDLLLLVSPVNGEAEWRRFQRRRYRRAPTFHYRPCPVDPSALKRRLFAIPVDRVEDPTIADLFDQQRETLDRQLSLLRDRERPSFLYDSLALYGEVDDHLSALASRILERVPPRATTSERVLRGEEFASIAARELEHYTHRAPDLKARIEVRDDVTTLMISNGNLLVARDARIPSSRVEALLNHELGTHLVTNYNGRRQRLRLLGTGLAGYESLQEGLGVFAEYLVGGLSGSRLRTLAGRVVACRLMVEGADFVETFRELTETHGFGKRAAFTLTTRIHRSGGFVKDSVYLRGIREVFAYVRDGGSIGTLFTGKMALSQVPVIRELQRREVLEPPALHPRYLESEEANRRLASVGAGFSFDDLVEELTA